MEIIDSHIHCEAADQVPQALDCLEKAGVGRAGMLSYGHMRTDGEGRRTGNSNPAVLAAKARFPERVFSFAGLNHIPGLSLGEKKFAVDLVGQAERAQGMGMDGIKLLETKPSGYAKYPYQLAHKVFRGFFTELEERGIPLIWHVADPETFWDRKRVPQWALNEGWYYGEGDFPSLEQLYDESLAVVKRQPRLKVIFAHFYFLSADLGRLSRLLEEHPGMNVDITPGSEMYFNFSKDVERSREFFIKHAERIVFGTDIALHGESFGNEFAAKQIGWMRRFLESDDVFDLSSGEGKEDGRAVNEEAFEQGAAEVLRGIKLPVEALGKIYHANFERLVGRSPRPLDREKALEECDRSAVPDAVSRYREMIEKA